MLPPLKVKDREILELYDETVYENGGKPLYFNLDNHIIAVEQLICADELQMALQLCDMIPGWYRDNYPKELTEIKNTLMRQCYDQFDYANDDEEAGYTKEECIAQCFSTYTWPRADILAEDIKKENAQGKVPWLCEISPSHGWLPIGFATRGLKFNFFGKNLNQRALVKIKDWLKDFPSVWQESPKEPQGKWLINFESLEHMWRPEDLPQAAKKLGYEFDRIYLSTPKYTLGGGLPDWKTRRLGHVRTWTPNEFLEFSTKHWPGYHWQIWKAHSMVLKGVRSGGTEDLWS